MSPGKNRAVDIVQVNQLQVNLDRRCAKSDQSSGLGLKGFFPPPTPPPLGPAPPIEIFASKRPIGSGTDECAVCVAREGSFGKVSFGHEWAGWRVAVKTGLSLSSVGQMQREAILHANLSSPFIVTFIGVAGSGIFVCTIIAGRHSGLCASLVALLLRSTSLYFGLADPLTGGTSARTSQFSLVLEEVAISVETWFHNCETQWGDTLPTSMAIARFRILDNLASAISYLHSVCVAHGDVHIGNLLFRRLRDGIYPEEGGVLVKLCDFGRSMR